jgi:transposase
MEQYIGVDLHKSFLQVCAVDGLGQRCWEDRFETTPDGIARFLSRTPGDAHVAVEASGPTWAFVDRVRAHIGDVHVVDAGKTRLKAGYAAKTDRLDARRLADALRRASVVTIYYPPPAVRDVRELCRYRRSLVRVRAGVKQRIHGLLLRHGVVEPEAPSSLWRGRGAKWLASVELPGRAGESLVGLRQLLGHVAAQVTRVEREVLAEARRDPIVPALQTLPGIGPVLGLTIRAEIGDIARFPDGPHLASYAGVVPRVHQSGARRAWTGPLTKHGSPWLRWALIEAAIHGPKRADAIGRWARRLALQKGALKARAAIARALCAEIYVVWPRT